MLVSMLDSHPEVLCHSELWLWREIQYAYSVRDTDFMIDTRAGRKAHPFRFYRRTWRLNLGHKAVGFKLLSVQNHLALTLVLLDRGVKKVLIHRRNWLENYASRVTASRLDTWEASRDRGSGYDAFRVDFEFRDFDRYVRRKELYFRIVRTWLRLSFQPFCDVAYEVIREDEAERRRVLAFLGVNPDPSLVSVGTKRQSSRPLSDRFSNWDEVVRSLTGTRYEPLLSMED